MTIQKRFLIMIVLALSASILYGAARYHSYSIILFVVDHSLAQKAPSGTDLTQLRERFHSYLSATPDQTVRIEKLLRISQYLEKVQQLTHEELNELMTAEKLDKVPVL